MLATTEPQPDIRTFNITKTILINAPMDIVFQTLLEPQGLLTGMNLKIEPWPGGRWYRDLGNNTGHLWGHVQVIKPPKLLEITGPMFMSYPVASHLQYRLTEEAGQTRLTLIHKAIGLLDPEQLNGTNDGWTQALEGTKSASEAKVKK